MHSLEELHKYKPYLPYLKIAIGLGLLVFLFSKISLSSVVQTLQAYSWKWLLLIPLVTGLNMFISAWKLLLLSRATGKTLAFFPVVKAYYIGLFFNNFLPTDIGGDIFKIHELRKNGLSGVNAAAAVFLERAAGFLTLLLLLPFAALSSAHIFNILPGKDTLLVIVLLYLTIIVAALIGIKAYKKVLNSSRHTMRSGKFWDIARKVRESARVYKKNHRVFIPAIILSLIFYLFRSCNMIFAARAVGCNLPFVPAIAAVLVVSIVSLIPISLNALGTKEGTLTLILRQVSFSVNSAFGVALLLRCSDWLHSLVGGLCYLWFRRELSADKRATLPSLSNLQE